MTDTIDVAALVEELNAWGPFVASGYECPAASKAMHRAVTALQSQAEQLTEAKSLICVLQLELGHSGNLIAELLTRATTAEASLATMREALRGNWHGVFLDGRNEHGSHVLMLPERSIELEQGSNGDFLKQDAERIIAEAERLGFEVGHAVVVTFTEQNDDDLGGYYEFSTVSLAMTELMYGSTDEQREINRALGGSNAE